MFKNYLIESDDEKLLAFRDTEASNFEFDQWYLQRSE